MQSLEVVYPWGTENLRLVTKPDPLPGPYEILVRMRAASLNFRDSVIIAQGGYAPGGPEAEPVVPFCDGCGVVEAIGEGVSRFAVGDRITTLYFPDWHSGPATPARLAAAPGFPGVPGAGRELAAFRETAVSHFPDFLTDQEAATLPCAALTAWRALFYDASLQPGDSVVLQGTGGVSIFALQFAKAAGLRTIITSSSDEKLARARDLGATHLINYRTMPNWGEAVREATSGNGADLVLEVGGAGTIAESLKAVRMGGHIAVIGMVSGGDLLSPNVSPGQLIGGLIRIQGLMVGSTIMFESMCRFLDLHRLRPVIDAVFPWTEAAAALKSSSQGQHFGKIVLEF